MSKFLIFKSRIVNPKLCTVAVPQSRKTRPTEQSTHFYFCYLRNYNRYEQLICTFAGSHTREYHVLVLGSCCDVARGGPGLSDLVVTSHANSILRASLLRMIRWYCLLRVGLGLQANFVLKFTFKLLNLDS